MLQYDGSKRRGEGGGREGGREGERDTAAWAYGVIRLIFRFLFDMYREWWLLVVEWVGGSVGGD